MSDGPSGNDALVMPASPPLQGISPPAPPAPPVVEQSPWLAAPVAPASWRLGGLLLDALLVGCTVVIGWLAWWIIGWDSGRSPAKSILHTRVVRADNRELPGFGLMALREVVGKAIPAGVGLIGLSMLGDGGIAPFLVAAAVAWYAMSIVAALLDQQRRTLWDTLAGTIVVLDAEVSRTVEARTQPI